IEDAALVHRLTGCCPSVALHIPWDKVENWEELREFAEEKGLKIGAINPNLFQDPDYKYGSLTNPSEKIRKKAIAHVMECVDIAEKTGSKVISLWLADGTDYPGQDDFRSRKKRLEESLRYIYENMPADMYLLIEYKFFEPAFYHTDIPDWGMSYLLSEKLGERALVLVDLGHHPQGTNIEYIVATLLSEKKLGGFHLNNRKYADDDLTIASINPYEVFLIFKEIVFAWRDPELSDSAKKVVLMFDQAHITKPKILAMIQSVLIAQELFTKALLIDENLLREAQKNYDVVEAEEILLDAFRTDVRPILREYRRQKGLPEDPLRVFREEDYMEKRRRERR
ncbi:MAG TPA: L-rhamnose isomerase, partial [Thermotoga naphthophila]|nr:L-rhamnose isomerase [Thermotoga petrophila]